LIFDLATIDLPAQVVTRLGGPVTPVDVERFELVAHRELGRAFALFRLDITDSSTAFWRVRVLHQVTPQAHAVAGVGESVALGPLGGGGFIDFSAIADQVARFAPANASHADLVDAIGRGIGRVAAHELGHQILGPVSAHNDLDDDAYENGSSERASQYFGDLRWTTWQAQLANKLGAR